MRGRVAEGTSEVAVAGAVVRCEYDPGEEDSPSKKIAVETQTDFAGEFVLFFPQPPRKELTVPVVAKKGEQTGTKDGTISEGKAYTLPGSIYLGQA